MRRKYLKASTWRCNEGTVEAWWWEGTGTTRPWADENGTWGIGIELAYPISFPWHIPFPFPGISTFWCESCTIKPLWNYCGNSSMKRDWIKEEDVGFRNNSAVLLWQREACTCMHTSVFAKGELPCHSPTHTNIYILQLTSILSPIMITIGFLYLSKVNADDIFRCMIFLIWIVRCIAVGGYQLRSQA